MKKIIKSLVFYKLIVITLILNLLTIVIIFLLRKSLPPEVPLFYGLPEGIRQLVKLPFLTIPPISSIVIIIINILIGQWIKNDFLQKVIILAGVITCLFSIITIGKIILLVGSF